MKSDYHQIVTEAGRSKYQSKSYKKALQKDISDLPNKESIRAPYRKMKAELLDNIKPLYRMLLKNCGRSWNEVYSEIRQWCRGDSVQSVHILEHIRRYVEEHATILPDGRVIAHHKSARYHEGQLYEGSFYVDYQGILKQYGQDKKFKLKHFEDPTIRTVDQTKYYLTPYGWFSGTNCLSEGTSFHPYRPLGKQVMKMLIKKDNIWQFVIGGDEYKGHERVLGPFKQLRS